MGQLFCVLLPQRQLSGERIDTARNAEACGPSARYRWRSNRHGPALRRQRRVPAFPRVYPGGVHWRADAMRNVADIRLSVQYRVQMQARRSALYQVLRTENLTVS